MDFETHREQEAARWDSLIKSQEQISQCVRQLSVAATTQGEATKGIVEAWQAGTVVGRLAKYLSGFAIFVAIGTWLAEKFGH